MSDTECPHGWTETKLNDIADVVGGIMKDSKRDSLGYAVIPYLRVANVQRGRLDLTEIRTIPVASEKIEKLRLLPGDLLLNEGGDRDKLGRGWVWEGQLPICIHQNHVFRARFKSADINPYYVAHYANSVAQGFFLERGSQSTNLASISLTNLVALPIKLPPASEQRRIVAKLDALQSRTRLAREALAAIPTLLDHYRQSVLAAAFRGDLTAEWRANSGQSNNLYEEEGLPDIPESWAWKKLPELGELGRGKSRHRPRNDPALYGGSYPFIQTGDVARSRGRICSHSQTYTEFGLRQSRLWPAQTVVITIAANIADTAILTYPACFPDSVVGFTADQSKCLPDYVEYFIRTAKRDLSAFAPATAQKNINLEILQEVRVPSAPLAEQVVIVDRIRQAERFINAVQAAAEGIHIDHLDHHIHLDAHLDVQHGKYHPIPANREPC